MDLHVSKRWSVNALSQGQTPLRYFCDGRPLTQSAPATLDNVSPVEHLLIAVAGCFASSCRAVLLRRGLSRTSFEVVAIGDRTVEPANRLAHLSVAAIFHGGLSEAEAAAIAEEARPLGTVTLTLLDTPAVTYSSRALKDSSLQHPDTRPAPLNH